MKLHVIFSFALALIIGVSACEPIPPADAARETEKVPPLLLNLTSDATRDGHSSLMGLHFAQQALDSDIPVTVFLNVDGVKLMAPGADTLAFDGENLQGLLKSIQQAGGKVVACPHCMQVEGVAEEDLLEGVRVADETSMMQKLKDGPTVMTY